MCGFSGFICPGSFPKAPSQILGDMGDAILSRGPDSSGIWYDEASGIGLSHRRLAIVDLTEAGHQPMMSSSGRFVIAFNGEIYNHLDIRAELECESDCNWHGHSDTETLLAAIEVWGLQATLEKAVGMFALALWDKDQDTLMLARDRFGEKPLYFAQQEDLFIFGSELKSLRAHPEFKAEIDRGALALLLRHNYIPAPYSIYKDAQKLMPGTILTYTSSKVQVEEYWSAHDHFRDDSAKEFTTVAELEATLTNAVRRQMLADVPLGAFLSGGIDSSLIVALMQTLSDKPVKTFSIGFDNAQFNEAHYAKDVAEHLGTEHTELYVSAQDALDVVDRLSDIYDEPFADSSQIPTFLVSKLARKHVTVALSGDAGDELFCGYNRYLITSMLWSKISVFPYFSRYWLSILLKTIPASMWNRMAALAPKKFRMSNFGDKIHKGAEVICSKDLDELYEGLVSHTKDPSCLVLNSEEPATAITDSSRNPKLNNSILNMMALDTVSYLPDDILVKVDRAAMANSLETRVPFLDHTVFELAWRLPLKAKLEEGKTKKCLRDILSKYVPDQLIDRPKKGFGVPLAVWLRGPLKEWAEDLLEEERLIREGFFDVVSVRKIWQEHVSGKHDRHYFLWNILMFQSWYEKHHK